MSKDNQLKPPVRKISPRAPVDLDKIRRIKDLLEVFGKPEPEKFEFNAGDVLIREGQALAEQPPLLLIDGEVEERKTIFIPGHGQSEQVLFIAREGDIVNSQSILDDTKNQPAFCSLIATKSGYGYILREQHINNLNSFGILLSTLLRQNTKLWESTVHASNVFSTFSQLLQALHRKDPHIPSDPVVILQRFYKTSRERDELRKRVERSEKLNERIRELNDALAEKELELKATLNQLANAQKRERQNAEENTRRQEMLERAMELEAENTKLRREKERLGNALGQVQDELAQSSSDGRNSNLQGRLDLEMRARVALEARIKDLEAQVSNQQIASSVSGRFPGAASLLASDELHELEKDAKRFREAAAHFENLAIKMHRAMELIAEDNPGLRISEDVMLLMVGEEPPERASVIERRKIKDQDKATLLLGSDDPAVSNAKARKAQAERSTAVIGSHDPGSLRDPPQGAPRPHARQKQSLRDSDNAITSNETPQAKRGPQSMRSQRLPAVQASGDSTIAPRNSALSKEDRDAILQDFLQDADSDSIPVLGPEAEVRQHRINAPYPHAEEDCVEWEFPNDARQTASLGLGRGDLPPAAQEEIRFPSDPPTPRLRDSSEMKTLVDGAHAASKIPAFPQGFTPEEYDSGITPVVQSRPPEFRSPESRQTRAFADTAFARPGEMPVRHFPPEPPTRREGSSGHHQAINFPAEPDTHMRQDWTADNIRGEKAQQAKKESLSDKPPAINVPPPSRTDMDDMSWMDDPIYSETAAFEAPIKPKKPGS
ncbi:MAG: hypothetical protein ACOYUZ_03565 [Patescibacteria group bacterium]